MVKWLKEEVIAAKCEIDPCTSANLVQLIEDDHTLPFIARYRKNETNNMAVEKLRQVFQVYDELGKVEKKIETAVSTIEKLGKMSPHLKQALQSSQSSEEVEHLYAPFKTGSSKTLAARARELGLEPHADQILAGREVNLHALRVATDHGQSMSLEDVKLNLQNIIADVIAKDPQSLDRVREVCKFASVQLSSSRRKPAKEAKSEKGGTKKFKFTEKENESHKFQLYFTFDCSVKQLKPHQVLAINRGEKLKYLKVKIVIPERVKASYVTFCEGQHLKVKQADLVQLVRDSIHDSYDRLVEPMLRRKYRAELKADAEAASASVFGENLKNMLLRPPIRGKIILALDPGFTNGCKCAVISPTGTIMDTAVFYLHCDFKQGSLHVESQRLRAFIMKHRCETIAIGSGTACRETEAVISKLIASDAFQPLAVRYCIVGEEGASIYSCSKQAEQDMPDLDQNLRSAVSIARRLQDPLAELVKIDPKHLGIGMYQHDVSETSLKATLDMVVQECVSFVGADLNSASVTLLSHVAGLSEAKAKAIVEQRLQHGQFVCRAQLLNLRGFGPKTYQECAGFLRVYSSASSSASSCSGQNVTECGGMVVDSDDDAVSAPVLLGRKRKLCAPAKTKGAMSRKKSKSVAVEVPNVFDATVIHPESYHIADKLLEKIKTVHKNQIGTANFIHNVTNFTRNLTPALFKDIAQELETDEHTLRQLLSALQQKLGDDCRRDSDEPVFRSAVVDISKLKPGEILTGVVKNVTHFGAFVDVGVGQDGLMHTSCMEGKTVQLGQRVKVAIVSLDLARNRIGLRLVDGNCL